MSLFSKKKLSELQAKDTSVKQHTVLIVDDEESNRKVMAAVLKDHYRVLEAEDAISALEMIENMEHPEKLSMVISDQRMPNMTGVELFERLTEIIPKTVRIIVTGFIDVESIIDSVNKAHIYKFILKPFERVDFLWTAKRAVENYELQKKLDNHLQSLEQRVVERTNELAEKNRELEQAYSTLEEVSLTDQLTQLKNRRFLTKYLDYDIAQTLRSYNDFNAGRSLKLPADANMIFFLIDLDHFKPVNDTYGHAAGDQVLKDIKLLLEKVFRASDYLVRWGGEEFLVVVRAASAADAPVMSERLREVVAGHSFSVGEGLTINKTCSIGYATYPFIGKLPESASWEQVVSIADHALYTAKENGRNAWVGLTVTPDVDDSEVVKQSITNTAALVADNTLEYHSNINGEINWHN
ncbi:MAG: diguanylate cyclase (GGDEF)-like protein [Alteromonadaceae bacterium]|jgi:diguanylate cyclase (GGDEF)-like protein